MRRIQIDGPLQGLQSMLFAFVLLLLNSELEPRNGIIWIPLYRRFELEDILRKRGNFMLVNGRTGAGVRTNL